MLALTHTRNLLGELCLSCVRYVACCLVESFECLKSRYGASKTLQRSGHQNFLDSVISLYHSWTFLCGFPFLFFLRSSCFKMYTVLLLLMREGRVNCGSSITMSNQHLTVAILLIDKLVHHKCGGLTLTGYQMPTKASLSLPSGLWVKIRIGRSLCT